MTSPNRPPRILITNIVTLNTGDAAILQGMLQILRERYGADADIVVYDRAAKTAAKYYPWANFRQALLIREKRTWFDRLLSRVQYGHWVPRIRYAQLRMALTLMRFGLGFLGSSLVSRPTFESLRDYMRADLVVSTGGTYLIENYDLAPAIFDYRLTLAAKRRLIFFTQTLGPFTRESNRKEFAQIFKKADAIFLRDEQSLEHLLELGVERTKIRLARDAAFVLGSPPGSLGRFREPSSPLRIAVSVRSLRYFADRDRERRVEQDICTLITHLVLQCRAEVTFLSTCQGIDDYWTDDADVASRIKGLLPVAVRDFVTVDRQFRQPSEIVEAYGCFDAVIAMRMHAAILALVSGTPVYALAYEFKILELFRQLQLGGCVAPVERINAEAIDRVASMIQGRVALREKLANLIPVLKAEARSVIAALPQLEFEE